MSIKIEDKLINEMLLNYQKNLIIKAETIGIMTHSGTNGTLKEFMVKSVLNSLLPKACGVYSGLVFDGKGNKSKQIDIIIYDERMPKFEIADGIGYFPIEGVIATIEVKTNLNKGELNKALENCKSILDLQPIISGNIKILSDDKSQWIPLQSSNENRKAHFNYQPATYIFSFDSVKMETCFEHTKEWWDKNTNLIADTPLMPRVILGKEWIGLLDDTYIKIPEELRNSAPNRNGMVFIKTDNAFSYFISHLLQKISVRIKAFYAATDSYYTINCLLPIERFLSDDQQQKQFMLL